MVPGGARTVTTNPAFSSGRLRINRRERGSVVSLGSLPISQREPRGCRVTPLLSASRSAPARVQAMILCILLETTKLGALAN